MQNKNYANIHQKKTKKKKTMQMDSILRSINVAITVVSMFYRVLVFKLYRITVPYRITIYVSVLHRLVEFHSQAKVAHQQEITKNIKSGIP